MNKLLRENNGFTLIELALVVLIVGMLTLMAGPTVMQKNRSQSVNGFAQELNWALEIIRRHFNLNGKFPENWQELLNVHAIPRVPVDPFGGNVTLITDNTADPKTCIIRIQNGVAATEYGGIIVRRVPYASHDINNRIIDIEVNEFMNWLFKEIVYMGIHQDGDLVPKKRCIGFPNRYIFTDIVALQSDTDTPLYAYRSWVTDYDADNYQVHCKLMDGGDNNEANDCLIKVMEVCH